MSSIKDYTEYRDDKSHTVLLVLIVADPLTTLMTSSVGWGLDDLELDVKIF